MLEKILEYERNLFLWINHTHTPFLDQVMWIFAGVVIWFPLLLIPLYYILQQRKDWLLVTISTCLVSLFSSAIPAFIFKPLFTRFRPTNHPDFMDCLVLLNDYKGGGLYGFISGHSCTAFGFAVFSILLIKNKTYTFFILLWAFTMAYSRIYLGVHFISDVVAGIFVGSLIGWIGYNIHKNMLDRYYKTSQV